MKLDNQRESNNVEDVRSRANVRSGRAGGLRLGGGKMGLGTVALALVASYFLGINPMTVLNLLGGGTTPSNAGSPSTQTSSTVDESTSAQDPGAVFVRKVLATTEDVWKTKFQALGVVYEEPKLQIFRGQTQTACGAGESAMGPFYCPADRKVYIDLDFFDTLKRQLGAPGDFAQAYVIAHEVGHHIQNLAGTSEKMHQMQGQVSKEQYNAMSVRLELQADCYAGIWAHSTQQDKQIMESGDLEEAMNAAKQIGDDTLQQHSQGRIVPENFTHGSSEQRMRWFKRGFETGEIDQCDTFSIKNL